MSVICFFVIKKSNRVINLLIFKYDNCGWYAFWLRRTCQVILNNISYWTNALKWFN